ncbi:alpha/beta hydrolase [Myceligenerans crystallogenes]|uniref:AB hydrolase-1 domain-containing protein n=1 Tax=Myceligenerans crystallogenes TaxID=316335 RepID=A0ABP4ZQK4_9MICO
MIERIRGLWRTATAPVRAVWLGVGIAWQVYHPAPRPLGDTPESRGLEFETWNWRTHRDRIDIEGWFVEGTGPDAVLVQHGVGRSRSETLAHVELLHQAGYHVLTVDMRNHGASGRCRSVTAMSSRYTSDLLDALSQLRSDPRVSGAIGCLSMSFSTWPAVSAGATTDADRLGLRAVVCDSGPVIDIRRAIARFATALAWRDERVSTPAARRVIEVVAPSAAALILAVGRRWPRSGCELPVLLVAGGRDRLLPADEVTAMTPYLPDVRTWVARRASHLAAITSDPAGYREQVIGFFDEHLRDGYHVGSGVGGAGMGAS